jgi:hypothetical protein
MNHFINNNTFRIISTDIAKKHKKRARQAVNVNRTIINKDSKWKYINMNPTVYPYDLTKLHKPRHPKRLIANWCNASAYKFAKLTQPKSKAAFYVQCKNWTTLMEDLNNSNVDNWRHAILIWHWKHVYKSTDGGKKQRNIRNPKHP